MPKFRLTDPEGRSVVVSGDTAPTEEEAEGIFQSLGPIKGPSQTPGPVPSPASAPKASTPPPAQAPAQAPAKKPFVSIPENRRTEASLVASLAARNQEDPALMLGLVSHETAGTFDPTITPVDPKTGKTLSSAKGLFQLLEGTAQEVGIEVGKGLREDPETNIRGGLANLKNVRERMRSTLGREPSEDEVLLGHFEGAVGATRIINAGTPASAVPKVQDVRRRAESLKDFISQAQEPSVSRGEALLAGKSQFEEARKEELRLSAARTVPVPQEPQDGTLLPGLALTSEKLDTIKDSARAFIQAQALSAELGLGVLQGQSLSESAARSISAVAQPELALMDEPEKALLEGPLRSFAEKNPTLATLLGTLATLGPEGLVGVAQIFQQSRWIPRAIKDLKARARALKGAERAVPDNVILQDGSIARVVTDPPKNLAAEAPVQKVADDKVKLLEDRRLRVIEEEQLPGADVPALRREKHDIDKELNRLMFGPEEVVADAGKLPAEFSRKGNTVKDIFSTRQDVTLPGDLEASLYHLTTVKTIPAIHDELLKKSPELRAVLAEMEEGYVVDIAARLGVTPEEASQIAEAYTHAVKNALTGRAQIQDGLAKGFIRPDDEVVQRTLAKGVPTLDDIASRGPKDPDAVQIKQILDKPKPEARDIEGRELFMESRIAPDDFTAAVRFADGEVELGLSHPEILARTEKSAEGAVDGFVVKGKFKTREEAAATAVRRARARAKTVKADEPLSEADRRAFVFAQGNARVRAQDALDEVGELEAFGRSSKKAQARLDKANEEFETFKNILERDEALKAKAGKGTAENIVEETAKRSAAVGPPPPPKPPSRGKILKDWENNQKWIDDASDPIVKDLRSLLDVPEVEARANLDRVTVRFRNRLLELFKKNRSFADRIFKGDRGRIPGGLGDQGDLTSTDQLHKFLKLYLESDEAAKGFSPKATAALDEMLDEISSEIPVLIQDFRRLNALRAAKDPLAEVMSRIVYTEPTSLWDAMKRTFSRDPSSPLGGSLPSKAYTRLLDRLNPIKHLSELAHGKGKIVDEFGRPSGYILTRNLSNLPSRIHKYVAEAQYDFKSRRDIGPGLDSIVDMVKDRYKEFDAYLAALRAEELSDFRGIETGIRPDAARAVVEKYRNDPLFTRAAGAIKEYTKNSLQFAVDAGILTPEKAALFARLNENYVPFHRVFVDQEEGFMRGTNKIVSLPDPYKKIKGSERELKSPLEALYLNTAAIVNTAERNRAALKIADELELVAQRGHSVPVIASKLPDDAALRAKDLENINVLLQKEGIHLKPEELKVAADLFRPTLGYETTEPVISVWRKGQRELWRIADSELYTALNSVNLKALPGLVRTLSVPTKVIKFGILKNPTFGFRNFIREQTASVVQSQTGMSLPFNPVELWSTQMGTKSSELYSLWRAAGGDISGLNSIDPGSLRNRLRQHVEKDPSFYKNVALLPRDIWRGYNRLLEWTENITRRREFKRAIEQGTDPDVAAFMSREIGIDYARMGAYGQVLNALIPFWNPSAQGFDKALRTAWSNPGRVLAYTGTYATASAALYALNRNEDWYINTPQVIKDLFWLIPTGIDQETGDPIVMKIPRPFAWAVPSVQIERMLEWGDGNRPDLTRSVLNSVVVFTPETLSYPAALLPFVEVASNTNMFFNAPIENEREKRLPLELRDRPYTTEVAKMIAKGGKAIKDRLPESFQDLIPETAQNAIVIDFLIQRMTGGLGTGAAQMVSEMAAILGLADVPPNAPIKEMADIPFLGQNLVRHGGFRAESLTRFYKDWDEGVKTKAGLQLLIDQNRPEEARRWAQENRGKLAMQAATSGIKQAMDEIREAWEGVRVSSNLSPIEKTQKMRDLEKKLILLTRRWDNLRPRVLLGSSGQAKTEQGQ